MNENKAWLHVVWQPRGLAVLAHTSIPAQLNDLILAVCRNWIHQSDDTSARTNNGIAGSCISGRTPWFPTDQWQFVATGAIWFPDTRETEEYYRLVMGGFALALAIETSSQFQPSENSSGTQLSYIKLGG